MALTSRFIAVIFILGVVETHAGQSRSVPDNLRRRVERLPMKLTALYHTKESALAGTTISMANALVSISDGLLDNAVILQAFVTGQQPEKVRAEIRRDREALARNVVYERNAEAWGGTMNTIDAAAAGLGHVENLISFNVTLIFENDRSFNLENWYTAWRKASKRNK